MNSHQHIESIHDFSADSVRSQIRLYMKVKNITITQLATRLGTTRGELSRLLSRPNSISIRQLAMICSVLGVDIKLRNN